MSDVVSPLALITGATRGIGRAIALELAARGCDLLLAARTSRDLEALQSLITTRHEDCRVSIAVVDLRESEYVHSLIEQARRRRTAPDLLVNNVGMFAHGSLLEDPPGKLEQMMQLNLYVAYQLVRGLVPSMVERGTGHIFNICSIASRQGFPDRGAYVITKHALLGLSRALRAELEKTGVRVTAILPGPTDTSSWPENEKPADKQLIAPEDVARMLWAAYELSDKSVAEEILLQPQERWLT